MESPTFPASGVVIRFKDTGLYYPDWYEGHPSSEGVPLDQAYVWIDHTPEDMFLRPDEEALPVSTFVRFSSTKLNR